MTTAPMPLDEIVEEFEFLGDWDARCEFLLDLGLELPDLPAEDKTEENRVHGCQSMVWMTHSIDDSAAPPRLNLRATSDAIIVRGLIAVLLALFDEKTPAEVLATDEAALFTKLGLDRHLSPARKNGLAGMVRRVRTAAAEAQAGLSG